MRNIRRQTCIAILVTAIGTSQSAAKKAPQIPPDPTLVAIQNLSVLPIVDARAGEKKGVDLGKLQEAAVRALKHKHYPVSSAATSGEAGTIAVEDLENRPRPLSRSWARRKSAGLWSSASTTQRRK